MPKPVTVWAVELGRETTLDDTKGTLELGPDALTFSPLAEDRTAIEIPLGSVEKVRRLRGSPVLMVVRRTDDGGRRQTAFYFAQPPPLGVLLGRQEAERPMGLGAFRNPKRRARRDNAGYLGIVNRDKRAVLTEWVHAVRAAAETA